MLHKLYWVILPLFILSVTACEKDDPVIPNDGELITTLIYTLVPDTGGDTVVLSFQDLDGDGGNEPIITGGTLQANTPYTASLSLLNETESPAEDINEEILEEKEDHQFFFQISGGLDADISYADFDANNEPVGLNTGLIAGGASEGQLTIILRHEPTKSSSGDITNAGGETDIEATFDITIQ